MRKVLILILLTLAIFIGCGKDEEQEDSKTEQLVGTYRVYNPDIVGEKIDSVTLTIENNIRYRFVHYPFRQGWAVNICNSSGIVEEFGSNFATFFPDSIDGFDCDTIHVPRDLFTADFRYHGDTIHMDRDDGTLLYEIRLLAR